MGNVLRGQSSVEILIAVDVQRVSLVVEEQTEALELVNAQDFL